MTKAQEKVYEMLYRVQHFLGDHAAALGTINQSAARKELDIVVASMADNTTVVATNRAKAQGESANMQALRRRLRTNHMQQIAAIAQAELPNVPQFEALRLPAIRENTPNLVVRARAMAAVAREHSAVFVAHQLPADFADRLEAAADALEASLQQRSLNKRDVAGARSALAANRSRAHYLVRVLSTQVELALANDATLLGQWKFAKRVGLHASAAASASVAPTGNTSSGVTSGTTGSPTVASPATAAPSQPQPSLAA